MPRNLQLSILPLQKHKQVVVFLLFKLLIKLNQAKRLRPVKIQKFNVKKLINKKKIMIIMLRVIMMVMMMSGKTLIYKMQMKKANQQRCPHIRPNYLNNKKYKGKVTKHLA